MWLVNLSSASHVQHPHRQREDVLSAWGERGKGNSDTNERMDEESAT